MSRKRCTQEKEDIAVASMIASNALQATVQVRPAGTSRARVDIDGERDPPGSLLEPVFQPGFVPQRQDCEVVRFEVDAKKSRRAVETFLNPI
jgi:hypothetical protein